MPKDTGNGKIEETPAPRHNRRAGHTGLSVSSAARTALGVDASVRLAHSRPSGSLPPRSEMLWRVYAEILRTGVNVRLDLLHVLWRCVQPGNREILLVAGILCRAAEGVEPLVVE